MEISPKNINIKVSVIVATYRRDESLKRALESLIKQNYDNIEIIVVDDNAEVYWNSKVKKIVEEINRIYPIKYIVNKINNKVKYKSNNQFNVQKKLSKKAIEKSIKFSIAFLFCFDYINVIG